jgi:hypothetical protein
MKRLKNIPQQKFSVIAITTVLLISLFVILTFVFAYSTSTSIRKKNTANNYLQNNSPSISKTETKEDFFYTADEQMKKEELVSSRNIDDVLEGLRIKHIPEGKFSVFSDGGITSTAYQVDLQNNTTYQRLIAYLQGSEPFVDIPDNVTFNNSIWKEFSYTEASDLFTKDGFACVLFNPNYSRNKSRNNFSFTCSYIVDLSQNTYQRGASFITETLKKAGIDCGIDNCTVKTVTSEFPVPKYGYTIIYWDKNYKSSQYDSMSHIIEEEASQTAKIVEKKGWNVSIQDTTDEEKGWNLSAKKSISVDFHNYYFDCEQSFTLTTSGKRTNIECVYKDSVLEEVQKFYNPFK